jgi:DNA-binding HxlR family transcriptional regulator
MRHASLAAALPCPIARTLEVVGEWWSLLIIRDALLGAKRFDEFKRSGISDNILSARLKSLTEARVFKRELYQSAPDRYEYVLTEKGRALAPVVLALRAWGRRWTKGTDSREVLHAECGGNIGVSVQCEKCGEEPSAVETRVRE